MSNFKDNPYRDMVYGVDYNIPLINEGNCVGINFDNAATTPPLMKVMEDIVNFSPYYSSIHRGEGFKSRYSTYMYDNSRSIVKQFFNIQSDKTDVIYVKNCTEAINKLARIMAVNYRNTIVISTSMEHHSNDLPWRENFDLKYAEVDEKGNLDISDLEYKLKKYKGEVSLVTVTGASNVTGRKNPIKKLASLAHKYGARILVDGAQLVPHEKLSLNGDNSYEDIDFLVFSGHKIYAPFGTGVLIGPKNFFEENNPDHTGGGTIDFVSHKNIIWTSSPEKNEAGSPNVLGSVALASALSTLSKANMYKIAEYEKYLTYYLTKNMAAFHSVVLYGDYMDISNKVGILPFNIEGMHHSTVAKILSYEFGIAVRSGCFCAHPYIQRLLQISPKELKILESTPKDERPGMVRVSFGLYNTIDEIDRLLYAVEAITSNISRYNRMYSK